jgi:tRNA(adenine34) deaminase
VITCIRGDLFFDNGKIKTLNLFWVDVEGTVDDDFDGWMQQALDEARQCGDDVPVGALILRDGVVLASGRNQREAAGDPTGHAEIVAMREAARRLGTWRLDGTTLVCTLEPCPMCAEAMIQARVARLVYGAHDTVYGAVGSAFNLFVEGRTFPIPEVVGGIREEESRLMLRQFFKDLRVRKEGAKRG